MDPRFTYEEIALAVFIAGLAGFLLGGAVAVLLVSELDGPEKTDATGEREFRPTLSTPLFKSPPRSKST